jgi:hypothetical protein
MRLIYYMQSVSFTGKNFEDAIPGRFRQGTWTTPGVSHQNTEDIQMAIQLLAKFSPARMVQSGQWIEVDSRDCEIGCEFFDVPANCPRDLSHLKAEGRRPIPPGFPAVRLMVFCDRWVELNYTRVTADLQRVLAERGAAS